MQLICEAYQIMKTILGMEEAEIADVLERWNKGVLDSFLIEITRDILRYNDKDGKPLVTKILDSAGQKGTGKWTAINALDLGAWELFPALFCGRVLICPSVYLRQQASRSPSLEKLSSHDASPA
jgi:6-phosphogluconate dehydrogenase